MASEVRFCSSCGKPGVEGASFCAYCGVAIPRAPQRTVSHSVPFPDRSTLDGKCALIYAGSEEINIRRIGRLVAEATDRPLPDVTRHMRTSKGSIARSLDAVR